MLEGSVVFKGKLNGTEILIRHCRRDDVEILLSFINTLSTEQTYITFQGEQLTLEEESRYVEGIIDKAENHKAVKLLVFNGSDLIGVSDIVMMEKVESHIGIFGITIAKEWRKKGIGKFLMEKAIDEAKITIPGMQIITLGVFGNNPVARQLYEKMGFREYGLLPKGIQHKGGLIDHIWMYKEVHEDKGFPVISSCFGKLGLSP